MQVLTIPEVDCVKDEKGTQNKVHRILMYIHQKPPEVFRRFIVSLREGSHPHVANVLSLPPSKGFEWMQFSLLLFILLLIYIFSCVNHAVTSTNDFGRKVVFNA